MVGCCEDLIAFSEERVSDTNRKAVRVTIKGLPPHYYYRSDQWIHNMVNSPIQEYSGPAKFAPKELYGAGTFEIDEELTELI